MAEKAIAIYHRVLPRENFQKAANDLLALVHDAQARAPGKPRVLYLDIDGHRNQEGGFDGDMLELQKEFCLGLLMPFLTEAHLPLVSVRNPGAQRNDVPERLEIVGPEYKTGPRLEDLYLENFSNTEYQSEEPVYAYLTQVFQFLKRFREWRGDPGEAESYDPHHLLEAWYSHNRELICELFNSFVAGNFLSAAAMTRTLMESRAYLTILLREKSAQLLEDWYLCGIIRAFYDQKKGFSQKGHSAVEALCQAFGRDPEEVIRRFTKGGDNAWLSPVIPGRKWITFRQVCEALEDESLYQDYQWACDFAHAQAPCAKQFSFTFYESIYHLLFLIMSYLFASIRLYPGSSELEEDLRRLEGGLLDLADFKW